MVLVGGEGRWDLSGRKDEAKGWRYGGRKLLKAERRVPGCRRKRLLPQVWLRQVAGVLQSVMGRLRKRKGDSRHPAD